MNYVIIFYMLCIVTLIFLVIFATLIWYLVSHDRGPKEPIGALWVAFAFGIFAIMLSVGVEYLTDLWSRSFADIIQVILVKSVFVGTIEEFAKFLPLALYIYNKKYFNEHNDGIIYFAICGLTFGLFENLTYTFIYGPEVGILRAITVPIFHGASTAAVGFFFAKKKIDNNSFLSTILALLSVTIMHALYNFGLDSQILFFLLVSLIITLLLAAGLFVFYILSNDSDRREGISISGRNNYCRYCGRKNINKSLFCEYCGKKL